MGKVPEGWKGRFVAPKVDTKNKRSRLLNSRVQAATMEEISTSFTKLSINYPETYDTLPGLPPINNDNTKITILEEFDYDGVDTGGMFNWIYSINTKGSNPINGYGYQMYNNWDIRTPESPINSVLASQQNRLSYRGADNAYFILGDACTPRIRAAEDGKIYPPVNFYALSNDMISDAGTGVPPGPGSNFWVANKNKIQLLTDNLAINYLYGHYYEWDIDNNVSVVESFRQIFLNADLEAGYTGTINQYAGIYHDADGFVVGGNTTEAHFIKNTADMPITTAGGITFTNSLPAYADDAAAGTAGLTAGQMYQTDGTGAAPLNAAGILMIKQ
jgi:hypothetical protein